MVLHGGDEHLVTGADVLASVAARHQVDGLGGATHQDDLPVVGGVNVPLDLPARALEGCGRAAAELMHTPVHVGAVLTVEALQGVDHRPRFLGGGGIVQVDQGLAVDGLLQNRKVLSRGFDIEQVGARLTGRCRMT